MRHAIKQDDFHPRATALPTPMPIPTNEWIALLALIFSILASPLLFDLALQLGVTH